MHKEDKAFFALFVKDVSSFCFYKNRNQQIAAVSRKYNSEINSTRFVEPNLLIAFQKPK